MAPTYTSSSSLVVVNLHHHPHSILPPHLSRFPYAVESMATAGEPPSSLERASSGRKRSFEEMASGASSGSGRNPDTDSYTSRVDSPSNFLQQRSSNTLTLPPISNLRYPGDGLDHRRPVQTMAPDVIDLTDDHDELFVPDTTGTHSYRAAVIDLSSADEDDVQPPTRSQVVNVRETIDLTDDSPRENSTTRSSGTQTFQQQANSNQDVQFIRSQELLPPIPSMPPIAPPMTPFAAAPFMPHPLRQIVDHESWATGRSSRHLQQAIQEITRRQHQHVHSHHHAWHRIHNQRGHRHTHNTNQIHPAFTSARPIMSPADYTHVGFAINQMFEGGDDDDLEQAVRNSFAESARPRAAPVIEELPPATTGFTRSPANNDVVVCPNCGEELGGGTDGTQKIQVWLIKSCGHVYCGDCAYSRGTKVSNKKKGKDAAVPRGPPPLKSCVAPGCGKKIKAGGKQMIQLFL